ncbi:deleted in malignant brain tumors 1 protein-like, partial [Homalodisca vitripennis]|uniref:deleted in malignant brain tumors 1 protein-like n=1 Tax=Homalodisca vitripennis TaxID=197043 RepID=UPI001EEB961E
MTFLLLGKGRSTPHNEAACHSGEACGGNNTENHKDIFRSPSAGMFQNDGQKLQGTLCDHQFISSNYTPSYGRFYSPRYPSSYPKHIKCAYRFRARSKERIRVVFEEVTLQKGDV